MKKEMTRKLDRESQALVIHDTDAPTQRHVVISPTVTRRPALDQMLGDMQIIAQHNLERMRNNALNGRYLDREDFKLFTEISTMVIRQTRAEMEVERHVEQRARNQKSKEMATRISERLRSKGMGPEAVAIVLEELGLDD